MFVSLALIKGFLETVRDTVPLLHPPSADEEFTTRHIQGGSKAFEPITPRKRDMVMFETGNF
jgi:hypothetical protein